MLVFMNGVFLVGATTLVGITLDRKLWRLTALLVSLICLLAVNIATLTGG